jgi:4-carboxymuconolactone decarboxylase
MSETLRPLDASEWAECLACVEGDMHGQPLKIHGLMANNPDLLAAWWAFRMHVVHGGKLSGRHRELIVLRVAAHTACWYEWASHVIRGLEAGLAMEEIAAVNWPLAQRNWAEADALVLRAVDDCVISGRILQETLDAMASHFSTAQVLDIIAIQGAYLMLATMINTWGLDIDECVQSPPGYSAATWSPDPLVSGH